jgi:uncharacterized protein (TIGR02118 family)
MGAQILVMYKPPKDAAAFDDYYDRIHTPLAKKIPSLKSFSVGRTPVTPTGDPSQYYLIAELNYDSMVDLQAGMGSPEGKATAEDLANFAHEGVDILIFDTVNP